MRILYIDMDSCRKDHLGCYGYERDTSPNIDALAKNGTVFENCFVSDAPCLPSRTALMSGQFGYRTGVVGHSRSSQIMRDPGHGHGVHRDYQSLPEALASIAGMHTTTISPFGQRHRAWHFYAGWHEIYNTGKRGNEIASETNATLIPWLERNGKSDNWFLHVNYWDPHRPYRTPEAYGNPFENAPPPKWPDAKTLEAQRKQYGPRSAAEPIGWGSQPTHFECDSIETVDDLKRWVDGYDTKAGNTILKRKYAKLPITVFDVPFTSCSTLGMAHAMPMTESKGKTIHLISKSRIDGELIISLISADGKTVLKTLNKEIVKGGSDGREGIFILPWKIDVDAGDYRIRWLLNKEYRDYLIVVK